MTTLSSAKRRVGFSAAALLAGCNGGINSSTNPTQYIPSSERVTQAIARQSYFPPASMGLAPKPNHAKSWMNPDAGAGALLYISNLFPEDVAVYSYLGRKGWTLTGTLTGFSGPMAPCSDAFGNVFIPDFYNGTVTEYAHNAALPTQVLMDTGAQPMGCSVDPRTGNLAVVNHNTSTGYDDGNIALYVGATGGPTIYNNPNMPTPYFAGYDNQGNLFVDGFDSKSVAALAELPSGSLSFSTLTVSGATLYQPGQVQWANPYLLVGDQDYQDRETSAAYQLSVKGTVATVRSVTPFSGSQDVRGFYKRGAGKAGTIIAPDYFQSETFTYTFPAGSLLSTIAGNASPTGATISQVPGK